MSILRWMRGVPTFEDWQRANAPMLARRELDRLMAKRLRDHQAQTPNLTQTEQLLLAGVARLLESLHE